MALQEKETAGFRYYETGEGAETIMMLHGLFGALSNFSDFISAFEGRYRLIMPILPIYDMPFTDVSVGGLVKVVHEFVEHMGLRDLHLLGNSLGGHVGILYCMEARPGRVASLTLTGSSGLFEKAFGSSFPRPSDYEYIKNKTAETFYDPAVATKELVDEVFGIVNDKGKVFRILLTAKSAIRQNLADRLGELTVPTLLIWGNQDIVTPPFVGEKFNDLIPNSRLHFIDKCGHAPMMERPADFNPLFDRFLDELRAGTFRGVKGAV